MASIRPDQEEPRALNPAKPRNFSLLVVIGRTAHPGHIRRDIERGIRSWDIDLNSCNLNQYLQEFLSQHTASFKGAGQKCLRHNTRVLDTQVLISPTQEQVHSEVFALLSRDSAHKLLILAGQSLEESGDLLFHKGFFSAQQLRQILTEQFLDQDPSPAPKLHLSLSCPNIGRWRETLLGAPPLQGPYTLSINPPEVLPPMESLEEFTSLVSGTASPPSPFDLLAPPTTVGFLKLSRPCCYVFPAGRGDCAFFAVNGFTVLVDGGSDPQACFWKLVRHLDRVDAVLLTHVGTENLPGVNVFLERKAAELEMSSEVKDDWSKRLISPELGVVFFNAPSKLQLEEPPCVDSVMKSTHQAALTLRLLKKLEIRPQPLFRPQGAPIEPLTLFQKMGVGQLDLYVLSPGKNSQEYQAFMHNWPDEASQKSQTLPLTALASVCALLVWHPACPQEKVVRVLFPGATPQAKLLQGLEKLKGLAFLQKPTVTTGDMEKLGEDRKRTESQDSGRSQGKETTPKHGKDEVLREKGKVLNGVGKDTDKTKGGKQKGASSEKNTSKKGGKKEAGNNEEITRNDQGEKDSKPKNKTKLKKEAKNDAQTGAKKTRKPSGKDANGGKKINAEQSMKFGGKTEQQGPKTGSEEKPGGSTMSETERSEVQETVDKENRKSSESGNEKILRSTSKEEEGKSCEAQHKAPTEEKADVDAAVPKVVGFPSPLNVAPKCDRTDQLDLTPTEYTLLDGALRNSPPSRSSPDNQAPVSPDERTVEPASPDSRPNSAGHTPYCLSPDDVWCNRATLSRIQAQMNSESANGSSKSNPERNTRERQLSFLSLGTFKEGPSDPSPSFATTTTTHSMPAEVSSPQSTEVDESLSMSLEQGPTTVSQRDEDSVQNGGHFIGMMKKPPRSFDTGRPAAPNSLHFEATHDVDLCLVSPCEFKHLKPDASEDPSRGGAHHHGNKDTSPSESNAPVCTEDCPSTMADGGLDSDSDESCSEPRNQPTGQALPPDPLPAPLRDGPPLPRQPDTAMPVPQSDANGKKAKAAGTRGKKAPAISEVSQKSGKSRTASQSGNSRIPPTRTPSSSARSAAAKSSPSPGSKSAGEVSIYVDLAYIPSGAASPTVSVDFFRSVRSSCYIVSGDSPERAELMRPTLDALLDAKTAWPDSMQVTVIPTFDSVPMQDWYQQTLNRQKELGISVLGSNSTVAMQDETFPACKVEF